MSLVKKLEMNLLSLDSVSLQKRGQIIVAHASAVVFLQDIIVVSGVSGSGKTSLLRLMNRLESPTAGNILFKNQPIEAIPPSVLRRHITFAPQIPVLFPGSVLHNLQYVDHINRRPVQNPAVYRTFLELAGLAPDKIMSQEAASLSLGEKQRLCIARALVNKPDILLLDEPTSALDPTSATYLLSSLKNLQMQLGMTIVMVTHQESHGAQIGTRYWRMEPPGRLIAET